jgi:hypothetical protein
VVPNLLRSGLLPDKVELSAGLDYGEEALRTCGILLYLDTRGPYPRIFAMSEYAPRQGTTVEMDCDGLLEMLAVCGDQWSALDYAWADKKYEGRTTRKNARVYSDTIARKLGLVGELDPPIRVAKRGLRKDHYWPSVRWLHEAMLRPGHFYVDESCAWLIEALEKWDGTNASIYKDILDALRYACRHLWASQRAQPGRIVARQF